MKAEIIAIGQAGPHEPDQWGYIWTVQNWYFGEGDFQGSILPGYGSTRPIDRTMRPQQRRYSSF